MRVYRSRWTASRGSRLFRGLFAVVLAGFPAFAGGQSVEVRAGVRLDGVGLPAGLTLSIPFLAQGLDSRIGTQLTPLPLTISDGARELWRGENVRIGLALPAAVDESSRVPLAELRDSKHGEFQAAVFSQVAERLGELGAKSPDVHMTDKAVGSASGRRELPLFEEIARRFKLSPEGVDPNPNFPEVLDGLFEGRLRERADALSSLGMGERAPRLDEAARRIVRAGARLEDPSVHPQIKNFLLSTGVLATVAGAKPVTEASRDAGAETESSSYLGTDEGFAELAETLKNISPDLQLIESSGRFILYDLGELKRVMLDDEALGRFRLWEDATSSDRREAYRDAVRRVVDGGLHSGFRAEEGLLFGFPLTAVREFAERAAHRGTAPSTVFISGDYGMEDIAWSTFTPLKVKSSAAAELGDNLRAMVWYDTVIGLARRYLDRLAAGAHKT